MPLYFDSKTRKYVCKCGECGGSFQSIRPHARTCGDTCRQRMSRRTREKIAAKRRRKAARISKPDRRAKAKHGRRPSANVR